MKLKRITMSMAGVIITAISVGVLKFSAFGVDPFQILMSGIDEWIPIQFGTLYVIVNVILLLFSLVLDRHYIGIATFINLFFLGYIIQFTLSFLQEISLCPGAIIRIISFIVGFVFLCMGSSMYMTADLGVSTYDAVALIFVNKWKMGKFKYIRICTDCTCVLLGVSIYFLTNGELYNITTFMGIGTIITALFMGPLVDWFNRKLSIPLLHYKL